MKIYNEISIDMNPESSSYGEALHEDSFDYEGPMMQMQDQAVTDKIEGYSGYESHEPYSYGGQDYYIMNHNSGQKLLLDLDGSILFRSKSGGHFEAWGLIEIDKFLEEDYRPGEEEQVELAPEIKYEDYEQYLDEETGAVSDPWGLAGYLQQLPPYNTSGKSQQDIYELLEDAPSGLFVSEQDISKAKKGYEGKRQSIHEGLMSKRQAAESQLATGGAYNPQQMELGNIPYSQEYYSGITGLEKGDPYGVSEKALYDFLASDIG
jgi:hypothetical protein